MPEWKCESLRLSLFSTGGVKLTADDWTNLSGQGEAEQEQRGSGRHVFSSMMMGGQLSLGATGNRCDCVLTAVVTPDTLNDGGVPSIGSWRNSLEAFQTATERYLPRFGVPVNRLAFGATLVSPQESSAAAYGVLTQQVTSLNLNAGQLHDLLFRINWPQQSQVVDTLLLNRLTTWQVQQIQELQLTVGTDAPTAVVNPGAHVTRLELDHNTAPSYAAPFDETLLVPIYRELTNLALQNADQGEVR